MAFFQRVFSYVFNEVLVNTLANSKSFQRFAVRTTHMVEEMSKKGVDTQGQLGEKAAEFQKIFRDEQYFAVVSSQAFGTQQHGPEPFAMQLPARNPILAVQTPAVPPGACAVSATPCLSDWVRSGAQSGETLLLTLLELAKECGQ
ncbi:MAG: hypothetical protein FRX49_06165 [Trebouxia sp. A1-2]|nr:MAG: hypothetical protein FRX49_06165 [Trebouxia sp. A1-2]